MDYLRRVGQIAALAGQRLAWSAPAIHQRLISVELPTEQRKAHYVLSMPLARTVLKDPVRFPQECFLTDLLASCEPQQVGWIQFFVDRSPEFNDGAAQLAIRRDLTRELAGYERDARTVTPGSIAVLKACRRLDHSKSTRELGFQPTSMREAMQDAYEFFLREGMIKPAK